MMAQVQISQFENRLNRIIIKSCAICISFYIDGLDLQNGLTISELMSEKRLLKFFYEYLKNRDYDKNFMDVLRRRRFIKIKMRILQEDIIKTIIKIQKLRNV